MNPKLKAFSLPEILVVTLILLILASLMFPVFAKAKESAAKSACLNNQRQATVGLRLYIDDQGDYPAKIFKAVNVGSSLDGEIIRSSLALVPYLKSNSITKCPLDVPGGRVHLLAEGIVHRSYQQLWFLWERKSGFDAWKRLLQVDPNPVAFRCNLHEHRVRQRMLNNRTSFGAAEYGSSQVTRLDGSSFQDNDPHFHTTNDPNNFVDTKKLLWSQATRSECPKDICDGLPLPNGAREL